MNLLAEVQRRLENRSGAAHVDVGLRSLLVPRCAAMIFASVLLAGCASEAPAIKPYSGPTQTLDQLVSDINSNVEQLPTLWAKGDFDAHIVDHDHKTDVNGTAYLMHASPQQMLFIGKADVLGEVFRMGCGPDKYWVTVKGDTDTCWWGTYTYLDRVDKGAIPVRPDLVEAVLGLDAIDPLLTREPCPVMRFNNDQRAYMLVWNMKLRDRWVAQKEIWYDVDSKLPRLVNLFDVNGRIVLSAYLSDHKPVDMGTGGTQPSTAPMVATSYRLYFPDSGSTLRLHLTDLRSSSKGHPNAANFAFDPDSVDVKHIINLDEAAH
jgi:hypothetical protein